MVTTNLENMENLKNSCNFKNCQNFRENSGKFFIFVEKPGKLRENVKLMTSILNENVFQRTFSLVFLREEFENALEISGKTQGI